MKIIILSFTLLFSLTVSAQLYENFSDEDLSNGPVWSGKISDFTVEGGMLRSMNATANSKFYLVTPSDNVQNTTWSFEAELQFNPSGLNYTDIFLSASDSNLLNAAIEGYFVRLGGTKDDICLYKKSGNEISLLIDGADGVLNRSSNRVTLSITCGKDFNWRLSYNTENGIKSDASVKDSTFKTGGWFGFLVVQSTSSFFGKHFFDNISIAAISADTLPPFITSVTVESTNSVRVNFNESVDTFWANDLAHYQIKKVTGELVSIGSVSFSEGQTSGVYLYPVSSFEEDQEYILSVLHPKDQAGNRSKEDFHRNFKYIVPANARFKDIVITEIYPSPDASTGLPDKEFVEIHNTSLKIFDLQNYILSDPSSGVRLPSYLLQPGDYIILCKASDTAVFVPFGKVLGLPQMPSLNNTGDDIRLFNRDSVLLDRVRYSQAWYRNTNKDDGGHTLEIMDPSNKCLEGENWIASDNPSGGTPGKKNSVYRILRDTVPPAVSDVWISSDNILKIRFTERTDSLFLVSSSFATDPSVPVKNIRYHHDSLHLATIEFGSPLEVNTEYKLFVRNARDCSGNTASLVVNFAVPARAIKGDIVLNEILFNPYPFGADFVEFVNISSGFIDLKGWKLANLNNDSVSDIKLISETSLVLKPGDYIAFSANRENIINTYIRAVQERIIEIKEMPSYPDNEGTVVLLDPENQVIEMVTYNKDMHSVLVKDREGVSLEKVSLSLSGSDASSWTSASKESGFATPGYENSQLLSLGSENYVDIAPELITPNQDGDGDILLIRLKAGKPGSLRNVRIFDISGRQLKELEKNNYTGSDTQLQWDGSDSAGNPAPVGHYILWIEILDQEGNLRHLRRKIAVGERF